MDSIEKSHFDFDDFKKGLMLAGFLFPISVTEINEREELEEYERKLEKQKSSLFFKRSVLAAEITAKLYNEPSFGHIKFQKLLYLSENICQISIKENYTKQAAGPYDRKFMHSIDMSFEKQKWFKIIKTKSGKFQLFNYEPSDNYGKHKSYFVKYFSQYDKKVQWLINTFGKVKTDKVELVATLFACWKELIDKGIEADEENLLLLFYNWSDRKQHFLRSRVILAIDWMKKNKLTPHES
jgi:hypothetical protein